MSPGGQADGERFQDTIKRRVDRKRAARRLLARWLQFTPCRLEETETPVWGITSEGDVIVKVRLRVLAADVDGEVARLAVEGKRP